MNNEDIKVLGEKEKSVLKTFKEGYGLTNAEREILLNFIENLIKGYKELEEMLKRRIKYTNELEKDLFKNASNYVIPKSKVREKIEELNKILKNNLYTTFDHYGAPERCLINQIKILEQLLQEGDDK